MPKYNERRQFLVAGSAIAGLAMIPRMLRAASLDTAAAPHWTRYRDALVIDSCGSPGRDSPDAHPLDAAELADIRASGVTALNFTVGAVGSYANDYDQSVQNIAHWDSQIAAHTDVLLKITHGAQVAEAKHSGRLGIIYGFQDTTMYGENLDCRNAAIRMRGSRKSSAVISRDCSTRSSFDPLHALLKNYHALIEEPSCQTLRAHHPVPCPRSSMAD